MMLCMDLPGRFLHPAGSHGTQARFHLLVALQNSGNLHEGRERVSCALHTALRDILGSSTHSDNSSYSAHSIDVDYAQDRIAEPILAFDQREDCGKGAVLGNVV